MKYICDVVMVLSAVMVMGVIGTSDYESAVGIIEKPLSWYIVNLGIAFTMMFLSYELGERLEDKNG